VGSAKPSLACNQPRCALLKEIAIVGRLSFLSKVLAHLLNQHDRFGALVRSSRWFLGSRLVRAAVAIPFVNETKLLMANGMRGATENLHVGLSEFEDMAFVLHVLRQTDLFVDIGANVGAYTVLASGVAGSASIAFEPVPDTFTHLLRNIAVNILADRVDARNVAVGHEDGTLRFTAELDTINHVATEHDTAGQLVEVPVVKLDHALENREPTLIKIDVEGYEAQVLAGADETLNRASLLAVIMETNESGQRYGVDDRRLDEVIVGHGFERFSYEPFARVLRPAIVAQRTAGRNTLYVRDRDAVARRVCDAAPFSVHGRTV
jgi:FkbM family methyltransferase